MDNSSPSVFTTSIFARSSDQQLPESNISQEGTYYSLNFITSRWDTLAKGLCLERKEAQQPVSAIDAGSEIPPPQTAPSHRTSGPPHRGGGGRPRDAAGGKGRTVPGSSEDGGSPRHAENWPVQERSTTTASSLAFSVKYEF